MAFLIKVNLSVFPYNRHEYQPTSFGGTHSPPAPPEKSKKAQQLFDSINRKVEEGGKKLEKEKTIMTEIVATMSLLVDCITQHCQSCQKSVSVILRTR